MASHFFTSLMCHPLLTYYPLYMCRQPTSRPSTPSGQPSMQPTLQPTRQPSSRPTVPSPSYVKIVTRNYLGCFIDYYNYVRVLPKSIYNYQTGYLACIQQAQALGYRYVGLESWNSGTQYGYNSGECWAGNSLTSAEGQGGSYNCAQVTSTDGIVMWGGYDSIALYDLSSLVPTLSPTGPSGQPTRQPSRLPSTQPTAQPSTQPSHRPSIFNSNPKADIPTGQPTVEPSSPSGQPTIQPSKQPSQQPTSQPSKQPFSNPTSRPSKQPITRPSTQPSKQPSSRPTNPTGQPTNQPTLQPTRQPSSRPTLPFPSYVKVATRNYLGCFHDYINSIRVLPTNLYYDQGSYVACFQQAQALGYRYVGLESWNSGVQYYYNGGECWAGNSLSSAEGQGVSTNCFQVTSTDGIVTWGGYDSIALYDLSLVPSRPSGQPSRQPTSHPTVTVTQVSCCSFHLLPTFCSFFVSYLIIASSFRLTSQQ